MQIYFYVLYVIKRALLFIRWYNSFQYVANEIKLRGALWNALVPFCNLKWKVCTHTLYTCQTRWSAHNLPNKTRHVRGESLCDLHYCIRGYICNQNALFLLIINKTIPKTTWTHIFSAKFSVSNNMSWATLEHHPMSKHFSFEWQPLLCSHHCYS